MKGKTTEIDLLMIYEKEIFVFESKNYSGWIFGSENQLKWTQCFKNGTKEQFYNPIKQNRTHIRALANLLQMSEEVFASYIVFSERCELKKIPLLVDGDVTILQRPQMLYYLRRRLQYSPVYYSHEEIERIAALLKPFTQISREEKQQHIENLQTKCPPSEAVSLFYATANMDNFGDAVPIQSATIPAKKIRVDAKHRPQLHKVKQ